LNYLTCPIFGGQFSGAAIETLQALPQADRRLKALVQHVETLKQLKDYQGKVQEFVDAGNPAAYRRARALMEAVACGQRVTPTLSAPEVNGWLEELRAIETHRELVEKWGTFAQNLHPLLYRYQTAYEALHAERQAAYAAVKAELDALAIPTETLADRLCAGPVTWGAGGLTCPDCGTALETLYYQIQSAAQEKGRLIQEARGKRQDAEGTGQEAGGAEEFVVVYLHEVIATREIADDAALAQAIEELRDAIQAELKTGKKVVLA